jgi:hypothetical protein
VLRVWDYVTWPGTGWESCSVEQWKAFLSFVGAQGWYVELTLLTDDDSGRLSYAKELIRGVSGAANVLFEAGNEPETHKHIDTQALRSTLESSGRLHSSGNYEDTAKFYGTFGTAHTARDSEWSRKCHDLQDYWTGGGPSYPAEPAAKVPYVADEPIRPDQCNPGWWNKEQDFMAYGGGCSVMGAGALFHYDGGRFGTLPTDEETRCAVALLAGLSAFPNDAVLANYDRIVEEGVTLRTYKVGNAMVRIRPNNPNPPEPGWTSLDPAGILFTR